LSIAVISVVAGSIACAVEGRGKLIEEEREKKEKQRAQKEAEMAKQKEIEKSYEKLPKGICPMCESIIPLSLLECPKCGALFGKGSSWEIMPIKS
jgi:rubrerythrin